MFSYSPRSKMMIPPFSHDGVMHYGNFVPRLYNPCSSLDFTPGKIMPARVTIYQTPDIDIIWPS